MTDHTHRTLVDGCYRCDLGRDEEIAFLAEDYWDAVIRPDLVASGTPEDALASMRLRYVSDVRLNPVAVAQLFEWWDALDADLLNP